MTRGNGLIKSFLFSFSSRYQVERCLAKTKTKTKKEEKKITLKKRGWSYDIESIFFLSLS